MTNGWRTLSADPATFHHLSRRFGVKGTDVTEVLCLDPAALPSKDILGLILCAPYKDCEDVQPKRLDATQVPDDLYFSNQVIANACGTHALLHILMNLESPERSWPSVNIGDELVRHKDFVMALKPSVRGLCISNDMFLRRVHNSFGNLPTLVELDHDPANDVPPPPPPKKSSRKRACADSDEEDRDVESISANIYADVHHFIAVIPFKGKLWWMDGMQNYPTLITELSENSKWTELALEELARRIRGDDTCILAVIPDQVPGLELQRDTTTQGDPLHLQALQDLKLIGEQRSDYENDVTRSNANYLPFINAVLKKGLRDPKLTKGIVNAIHASVRDSRRK